MKKVIKLTESDLINLIKKVIRETEEVPSGTGDCSINCQPSPINRGDLAQVARINCCKSKDKNSEACKTYISKHNQGVSKCSTIKFLQ